MVYQIFNLFVAIVCYMALAAIVGTATWTISKCWLEWAKKTTFNTRVFVGLCLLIGVTGVSILIAAVSDANLPTQGVTVPPSDTALSIAGVILIAWSFLLMFDLIYTSTD